MAKYIKFDDAKRALRELRDQDLETYYCDIPEVFDSSRAIEVLNELDFFEFEDQEMKKTGKWIKTGKDLYTCSCCGEEWLVDYPSDLFKYCPHSGLKMEVEEDPEMKCAED